MEIIEVNTENRREARQFIQFPHKLYANCAQWVPRLRRDALGMLNRKKHPFFERSDASFFMAKAEGGEVVGRIAIIENKPFNVRSNKKRSFFYLFDIVCTSIIFFGVCQSIPQLAFQDNFYPFINHLQLSPSRV